MQGISQSGVTGPVTPTLAELLHRLRERSGFTQEELAERATLSTRTVSDLERGVNATARRETVRLLADALGLLEAERVVFEQVGRGRSGPAACASTLVSPQPGALPVAPTPLVGRDAAVTAVVKLFLSDDARLVTLLGPGGVGKTRLGLAVAAELRPHYRDGVRFVELGALSEPALVPDTVARSVTVSEEAVPSGAGPLADMLRDRATLLVLDNFEQLLAAAPFVGHLLAECPSLAVLVTSRTALRLRGEHRYHVPPLAAPDPTSSEVEIGRSPAVALFAARARAANPDWSLRPDNAESVAAICRQLDGLPLALELAAARVGVLSDAALLSRLSNSLRLLTRGTQDAPARQQTLRATLDWSFQLLQPFERQLLEQLSVFAGGFALDAVEAVSGLVDEPGSEVLDLLDGLVDNSLLVRRDRGGGEPLWSMLFTVREYAREHLEKANAAAAVRDRHLEWMRGLAARAEPELTGPDQAGWLDALERDLDNFRAAMDWSAASDARTTGLRLATALLWFWRLRGHLAEGRRVLTTLLDAPDLPERLRCKALAHAGILARDQGDVAAARDLLERGLATARRGHDVAAEAAALNWLGILTAAEQQQTEAVSFYEQSLLLHRRLGDRREVARVLNNLSYSLRKRGELDRAVVLAEESLTLSREEGNLRLVGITLHTLGCVLEGRGDLDGAAARFAESLRLEAALGDRYDMPFCLEGLVRVAAARGDFGGAAYLAGAADTLRRAIGTPLERAEAAEYERALDQTRAALGEPNYRETFATSATTPLEFVIAECCDHEVVAGRWSTPSERH